MTNKQNTLIVNLYSGPGAGKSTTAAWLFACLKKIGINAELVTEYAKDKVWEESHKVLNNQIYIFAKQHHRLKILLEKVDVIITDSPIMMGITYDLENNSYLRNLAYFEYSKMNNLNFFLKRSKVYNPIGRQQDEEQAIVMDKIIKKCIDDFNIDYSIFDTDDSSYNEMLTIIFERLQ